MDLEELAVAKSSYQKDVLLTDLTATEGGLKRRRRRRRRKTPSIGHVLARESLVSPAGDVEREERVSIISSKTRRNTMNNRGLFSGRSSSAYVFQRPGCLSSLRMSQPSRNGGS